jgi:hypothetical protein
MTERDARERDILVAANEYAYVQDLTKGDIVLYVGPTKISLSNTERIVELKGARFLPVRADDPSFGVNAFLTATSSQYIVLENPARDPAAKALRGSNASVELLVGRKIVVPGPATFPLWPGQNARVINGHPLREDEYLVVRYYDHVEGDPHPIGAEIVVRGSDVSFYVPRTGLEVLPADAHGNYVRRAWRFPRPGGLHVRVTKSLEAGSDDALPPGTYAAGTDVFLSDRDGFFFPSENVEVLDVVLPIPIAEKEGIYVRDAASGRIRTVVGPSNYIPDPTREHVVPRRLDDERERLYGIKNREVETSALAVYVPPSFAVLVTGKTSREVVVGPQTRILDFDEELEVLNLSTGRPKSDAEKLSTCFLLVDGNKVSDVVRVRTSDHVEVDVSLSYRVSFVDDSSRERWFRVKDYVGLLCDHLGSILRAAARTRGIERFEAEVLRTAILGEKGETGRRGRTFEENGMLVYDVEILDLAILDPEVKRLLEGAQRAAIVADVARRDEERRLAGERLKAQVDGEIHAAQMSTVASAADLDAANASRARANMQNTIELRRLDHEARMSQTEREAELARRAQEAGVVAFERQMAALAPELISTLRTLGHQQLTAELSKNVSPLAILGGSDVASVVEKLIGNLPIGAKTTVAEVVKPATGNGRASSRT